MSFFVLYRTLQKECEKHLGWQLLLPLKPEDEYCLKCIRVPSTDEYRDFDGLVISLTKVLIDSLNEKMLCQIIINKNLKKITGSISRLEACFVANSIKDGDMHIKFLRNLQRLRSTHAAHRKGSNSHKTLAKLQNDKQTLSSVFAGLVAQSISFLTFLIALVQEGKFKTAELDAANS